MIIVCLSRSGVLFNDTWENRAEYGDMFTAVYNDPSQDIYRVDIGDGKYNLISAVSGYWRKARNLELDLWSNGARHLNKMMKF